MMADHLEDENKHSPVENFNPLDEDTFTNNYLRQASTNAGRFDEEESDDNNSGENVDDICPNSDDEENLQYGTTPPVPRIHKREKLKNGNKPKGLSRSYKTILNEKRQQQPKTAVNVIKREFQGDPALCSLGEFDSDDNLDGHKERQERRRKESKKTLSKIRRSDQTEKRLSEDFSHMSVSENLVLSHVTGFKLEGSGRFNHRTVHNRLCLTQSLDSKTRRQITEPPQCPSDRVKFYQDFSTLINLGTEAKKREEKSSYKRQISLEQEQRRSYMIEQIWLELRSCLHNGMAVEEESEWLMRERQTHDSVIDEINNFSFAEIAAQDCPDSAFVKDPSNATNLFFKPNDESYKEHVSRSVSASFSDVNLTDETVCLQEKALVQVQKLLEKLDKCEACYSTTKAFCRANEKYKDPMFQRRVKCLNLWLNITCDLCQKLKLFGRIIGVSSRSSNWPLCNFEFPQVQPKEFLASPRPSIPNIVQSDTSDNNDGSDEEDITAGKNSACKFEGEADEGNSPTETGKHSPNHHQTKQVTFLCGGEDDLGTPTPIVIEPTSPMDASTPIRGGSYASFTSAWSSSALNISRASSELSLDEIHPKPSYYRHYAERCMRKMGLHRLNIRLRKLFHDSLKRAKKALERPKESFYTDSNMDNQPNEETEKSAEAESSDQSSSVEASPRPSLTRNSSLSEHGEWSQQFIEMGLPSFRPTYLFIVRIHVDVIHECLKIRKEQRPQGEPSFLSIRQLIRECKEVLKGATIVKQYHQFMVNAVIWDEQEAENKVAMDLTEFDDDLKSMLDVYFNYLQSWIYMLQSLPEASLGMKSALEEEWAFTKSICAYVINGEAEAGKKFSSLASSLLSSIGDFLDNGIDDNTRSLYCGDDEDEEEAYYDADCEDRLGDSGDCDQSGDENENFKAGRKSKQNFQNVLKNFKNLFNEARERASKALGFAKLLRKDLEIAADFNISVSTGELLDKLAKTDHIQVLAPLNSRYMMFIPKRIISNKDLILQLLNVTSGQEEVTDASLKEEGYLLMLRCEDYNDHLNECSLWSGEVVRVEPTAETAIALSHIEVMGLLFVVTHSSILCQGRKNFERIMGSSVQVVNEQTSCHQSIAESLSELKTNALDLMVKVSQSIQQVNESLNGNDIIQQDEHILKLYRETMLKIYDFGFEYQKELMRLISHDQKKKQCQMIVAFAKDWMNFVKNKCETGRGIRPRWATQGLEFVTLACEPKNVVYLTSQEFSDFQQLIQQSLNHIIGPLHTKSVGHGIHVNLNPDSTRRTGVQPTMNRLISCPENRFYRSISSRSVESEPAGTGHHGHSSSSSIVSTPSSPGTAFFADTRANRHSIPELPQISVMDSDDGSIILGVAESRRNSEALKIPRSERLRDSIQKLEKERETMLREKRVIGKLSHHIQEADYRMNIKRVKFRWQRGIKIGEGQFGKVYTAVNINTGELMAMKEMKFQPNDHMFLKETCDEIKNFEGISHENLVKYYGVEVHKEEMLIFMEYCDSGSIEEVARLGLPEYMIRRYTLEIAKAVAHLHENSLIHRDIKGANIFLTSQGHVKLGDFGCSVKLKNQQTMPGEVVSLVGTTAYMAPEVITQTDQAGHGRAADIWSLGCVVLEMFTGKRPWHELEHNIQVMFKVGTGHLPTIPESITKEGKSFIHACLVHDPFKRRTAQELLDHIFVKYYDEKDGNDGDGDDLDEEEEEKVKKCLKAKHLSSNNKSTH